ncbi:von Willebrand factor, type A [Paracoccaceae bacterium]
MKRLVSLLLPVALALAAVVYFSSRPPAVALSILAGSENQALEPLIQDWAADNNVVVSVTYLGSVDISRELQSGDSSPYDAVWPAHSLWIELGDTGKSVSHATSILRSPVVLGLRKSIAARLGWIGRKDLTIQDIRDAATRNDFRLSMTSATQSNSGASAYLGFLYAFAGDPDMLTLPMLDDPALLDAMRGLLAQVDRSSGSSGWLKDAFLAKPDGFDAMFNYESVVIETNQALAAVGEEPLYIIYPANGLAVADSPLGLIDKGDPAKEAAFLALQTHLLSPDTQNKLSALGRRAGLIGLDATSADPAVWNPDWGVDLARDIAPIPTPDSDVIAKALALYQTELRKPSLTIWVLDVSGSMAGEPLAQLKEAMRLVLDPDAAAVNLLQPSSRDVTVILPFNHSFLEPTIVTGGEKADLAAALTRVQGLQADGGTDVYIAISKALWLLEPYAADGTLGDFLPAIVAMTDGASDVENRDRMFRDLTDLPWAKDIPIHSIAFGSADEEQLKALSEATVGRTFKAGDDIAKALRSAKGYN